jgi:hypothetical protein
MTLILPEAFAARRIPRQLGTPFLDPFGIVVENWSAVSE